MSGPSIDELISDVRELNIRLLTAQEELDLGKLVREGDSEARRRFIECNIPLVISIAKNYQSLYFDDVVQYGLAGLVHAVDKFDYTKGFRFSTYAVHWIRQNIQRGISESHPIWIPEPKRHKGSRAVRLLRTHSFDEVASILECSSDDLQKIISDHKMSSSVVSYDVDNSSINPSIVNRDFERGFSKMCVDDFLSFLSPIQRRIIELRYGITEGPYTLREIGNILDLSAERIRQIESQAIGVMRRYAEK